MNARDEAAVTTLNLLLVDGSERMRGALADTLKRRGYHVTPCCSAQDALRHLGRQALHAYLLGFEHPVTGKALHFETGLPADLEALVEALSQPFTP